MQTRLKKKIKVFSSALIDYIYIYQGHMNNFIFSAGVPSSSD